MRQVLLTRESKTRLEGTFRALESAARGRDVTCCTNADLDFHRTLCELSGNRHLTEILNDVSTQFFAYELIRDLRNPGGYQFEEKVAGHRELLRLILTGTDQKIETGFRELFARFLGHVLTRFQADGGSPQRWRVFRPRSEATRVPRISAM